MTSRAIVYTAIGVGAGTVHGYIAVRYAQKLRRKIREHVERYHSIGGDPDVLLLRVLAELQAEQKHMVRGPYEWLTARLVLQELRRVREAAGVGESTAL